MLSFSLVVVEKKRIRSLKLRRAREKGKNGGGRRTDTRTHRDIDCIDRLRSSKSSEVFTSI